jgi:hypothetical protein
MASEADDRSWKVVVLSGANFPVPAALVQDQALREGIIAGTSRRIEFFLEALEMFRLPRAESELEFVGFLRKKYYDVKVDLVLAVGDYGLDFAERHGAALWPGTPVVFNSVSEELVRNRNLRPAITGQTVCFDVGGTLDLAVRLQPNAKRIVVITGVTDNDRYWSIPVTEALRRHEGQLEVTWLTNQSVPHLVEAVRKLPRDTIVLYTTLFRDASGQTNRRRNPRNHQTRRDTGVTNPIIEKRIARDETNRRTTIPHPVTLSMPVNSTCPSAGIAALATPSLLRRFSLLSSSPPVSAK